MNYFKIQELEVKKPLEGVEVRIVAGEKMTMAIYYLEPGAGVANSQLMAAWPRLEKLLSGLAGEPDEKSVETTPRRKRRFWS